MIMKQKKITDYSRKSMPQVTLSPENFIQFQKDLNEYPRAGGILTDQDNYLYREYAIYFWENYINQNHPVDKAIRITAKVLGVMCGLALFAWLMWEAAATVTGN